MHTKCMFVLEAVAAKKQSSDYYEAISRMPFFSFQSQGSKERCVQKKTQNRVLNRRKQTEQEACIL